MYNYVTVNFPTITEVTPPDRLSSFVLRSERYAHEIAVIKFRDWGVPHQALVTGTPVQCLLRNPNTNRLFYGYVHHAIPSFTPGTRTTTIVVVGASYPLSQASQRIFTDVRAHDIVRQIALEKNMSATVEEHPRLWPNISQAGRTDFELLVWLAKRCGYSLRVSNTEIYFKNQDADYAKLRDSAPYFIMRQANDPLGSSLYSFTALIGNSTQHLDSIKSAVAVSGVEPLTSTIVQTVEKNRLPQLRDTVYSEVFDRYATDIAAPGLEIATYEAQAALARNRYPYRAKVVVAGTPTLRPDMPIFLDGLGEQYSGYWVVLGVEHTVVEESLNNFKYTCTVEIGSDSLGAASVWTDGVTIVQPTVDSTTINPDSVSGSVLLNG